MFSYDSHSDEKSATVHNCDTISFLKPVCSLNSSPFIYLNLNWMFYFKHS